MTHAFRPSLVAFVALSLAACQPDAPIGSGNDGGAPGDMPPADVPPSDAPDAPPSDAPVCEPAIATSDCATEQIAQTICASTVHNGRPCHVCVQRVDAGGRPSLWMAVETPAACGCPTPMTEPPLDGGDGGARSCASNADCPSGQVCEYALGCEHTRGECHSDGCQSLPVAPQYCGCDGRTIQQTSACLPDRPYRAMGACPDGGPADAPDASDASGPTFACGSGACSLGAEACVYPPGPGICPPPDAGVCPAGCPGCASITPSCQATAGSSCAPGDCACLVRAFCMGRTGVCSGAASSGVSVMCMGA